MDIWTIKTYFILVRTSLKIMIIYGSVVVHSVHFSEGFVTLINTITCLFKRFIKKTGS